VWLGFETMVRVLKQLTLALLSSVAVLFMVQVQVQVQWDTVLHQVVGRTCGADATGSAIAATCRASTRCHSGIACWAESLPRLGVCAAEAFRRVSERSA
jgi:hypothetical protein